MARHHKSHKKEHHGHGHHDKMEHHDPRGHHSSAHSSHHSRSHAASEHYAGYHNRKSEEAEHGGMIHEDHNAVANMPQNVIMRPYRDGSYGIPEELDDTMRGIDMQTGKDDSQMMKAFKPHKY